MNERALLLDTHVWLWLMDASSSLTSANAAALEKASAQGRLLVSVISVWETAVLAAKRRVKLDQPPGEWVTTALAAPGLRLADLTPRIAVASAQLAAPAPKDPADRILIATAQQLDAILMTADRRIIDYARKSRAVRILKAGR